MAEWLRRGLQILARRFDSGSGLQFGPYFHKTTLVFILSGMSGDRQFIHGHNFENGTSLIFLI